MFTIVITGKDGTERQQEFDKTEITIGRVQGNDIILPKGNVSKQHSRIVLKDGRFVIVDLKSTNGTYVNGRKINAPLVIKQTDKIYVGDFVLTIDAKFESSESTSSNDVPGSSRDTTSPSQISPLSQNHSVSSATNQSISSENLSSFSDVEPLQKLMSRLTQEFDVHDASSSGLRDSDRWVAAEQAIDRVTQDLLKEGVLQNEEEVVSLRVTALREAVGLGLIESLLADDRVVQIVVHGPFRIFVDFGDGLEAIEGSFSDTSMLLTVIRRLLTQAGIQFDPAQTIYETILPNRVHAIAILPPIAHHGPILEIRRRTQAMNLEYFISHQMLSDEMAQFIEHAVLNRRNIFVTGPFNSGVTSLVSAIAQLIDDSERIMTIESSPELDIDRADTIALIASRNGTRLALSELILRSSILRADRLILDDIQGDEFPSVLTTLSMRPSGNIVGVHLNHEEDAIAPLRLYARMSENLPRDVIEKLLTQNIHIVIEISSIKNVRRINRIVETKRSSSGNAEYTIAYEWDRQHGDFQSYK